MTENNEQTQPVTMINVFKVDPENQQRLVALLSKATGGSVVHIPGFISSTLQQSLDGAK